MYRKKLDTDTLCPLEYGLRVFGGKWKARIICLLAARGHLRYGELRGMMQNITDAVLSSALRELAEDGIVTRTQYYEIPPRVEYSLSERGKSVVPILKSVCSWSGTVQKEESFKMKLECRNPDCKLI